MKIQLIKTQKVANAVPKRKCIALNEYVRTEGRLKVRNLSKLTNKLLKNGELIPEKLKGKK